MKLLLRDLKINQLKHFFQCKLPIVLCCLSLVVSCAKKAKKSKRDPVTETKTEYVPKLKQQEQKDKVMLCKINGEDWYYTELRCRKILSTDYKPIKKFVLNFKNKDSQAGESITLMYNANSKQLEHVDMALQDPNAETGRRIFCGIKGFTEKDIAKIKDIGMLTNIVGDRISGNATYLIPKNSKGVYSSELDKDISVTDLRFTNIQFEDESDY